MASRWAKNQEELARRLGVTPARVSQLKDQPWFPGRHRKMGWPVDMIQQAMAENLQQRSAPAVAVLEGDDRQVEQHGCSDSDEDRTAAIAQLDRAEDPQAVASAAVRLVAKALASTARDGRISPQIVNSLERSLKELRHTEAAYLDIGQQRGELVRREAAREAGMALASLFNGLLTQVGPELAAQVQIWQGDHAFQKLRTSEQQRTVRKWWEERAEAARDRAREGAEALLGEERGQE